MSPRTSDLRTGSRSTEIGRTSATDREIPDKDAFRIGEVAALAGVTPSVLRFWETEFGDLRPQKTRAGQRLYRRRDVEKVMRIRELLYDRGFTIAGAKRALRGGATPLDLAAIRREVEDLLRLVGE